jgi:mannose-6-phosphate isomerase-like protein (cupin superfamily)/ketosteroid isomerase-like protein
MATTDSVTRYFEHMNADEFDLLAEQFAADAQVVVPGAPIANGRDEIQGLYRRIFRVWSQHHDAPVRTVQADGTVTANVRFTGTLANGSAFEFDAVDVFDLDDSGLIAKLTNWYDSHAVREMLRAARKVEKPGPVRRVLTGETKDGHSMLADDSPIEPVLAHLDIHFIWGADTIPVLPLLPRAEYVPSTVHPPLGGIRVLSDTFYPGHGVTAEPASPHMTGEDMDRLRRLRSVGMNDYDATTGMHRTDSVDVIVVHSGELQLALEGGDEVTLRSGDHLIQAGAAHAWRNVGDTPCQVTIVMVGAERSEGTGEETDTDRGETP